mmetsp:Transcript_33943/g.52900  ORF Transcript_33943/g.52900 Transcript_33943/m.52900 type:complete len:323 (-) Transcript_33943:495-1463(-)
MSGRKVLEEEAKAMGLIGSEEDDDGDDGSDVSDEGDESSEDEGMFRRRRIFTASNLGRPKTAKSDGGKALAEGLGLLKAGRSRILDLDSVVLGPTEIKDVAATLKMVPRMREVRIRSSDLDSVSVGRLVTSIYGSPSVERLDFGHNNMGSTGAAMVLDGASEMEKLTELDLSDNNIGGDGKRALFASLGTTRGLKSLDLSQNKLDDRDCQSLAECVGRMSLTNLNLSQNNISNQGAAALADALRRSDTLATLSLMENDIEDDGILGLGFLVKDFGKCDCNFARTCKGWTLHIPVHLLQSTSSLSPVDPETSRDRFRPQPLGN